MGCRFLVVAWGLCGFAAAVPQPFLNAPYNCSRFQQRSGIAVPLAHADRRLGLPAFLQGLP
jgi:hypothetical protein